jgi:hypothetical protein
MFFALVGLLSISLCAGASEGTDLALLVFPPGGSSQLKGGLHADTGLHLIVDIHDFDEPVQLGQLCRLLAANQRPALFEIRQSSVRELNFTTPATPCARLQNQIVRDSLELFGEWQSVLFRMPESRPAFSVERIFGGSPAPFGQVQRNEFIIGPLSLELNDQAGEVIACPADQIDRTRAGKFVYPLRDDRLQFKLQIAVVQASPQVCRLIFHKPLNRYCTPLLVNYQNHPAPKQSDLRSEKA